MHTTILIQHPHTRTTTVNWNDYKPSCLKLDFTGNVDIIAIYHKTIEYIV